VLCSVTVVIDEWIHDIAVPGVRTDVGLENQRLQRNVAHFSHYLRCSEEPAPSPFTSTSR
jgi:hypothetical protein